MILRLLIFQLDFPGAQSLKDKRSVLRSAKDRIRSRFNASVIESALQDQWRRGELAVSFLAADTAQADALESRIDRLLNESAGLLIGNVRRETL